MTHSSETSEAELERRAAANEPEAQFEYGGALLSGGRGAAEGLRGIELVEAASRNGHAEAVAMTAVFEAVGVARPQSWARAFDRLQLAAELGSTHAKGQLIALSERGSTGGQAVAGRADWGVLRANLSIERLLAPPARKMMSERPRIIVYPGFASPSECNWAIARARDRLKPARVLHGRLAGQTVNPVRDNSAIGFQLHEMDVVIEILRARIAAATRLPVPIFEPVQVLHYAVGQQFRPHHDFLDPEAPAFAEQIRQLGQRIATVLVYLNDDYEGGETAFPKAGVSYRGRTGDALFLANVGRDGRPDPLTLHAGTPPSSGEKWVMSQWIRDRVPAAANAGGASMP